MVHFAADVMSFVSRKTLHCAVSTRCVVELADVVPRVKREGGRTTPGVPSSQFIKKDLRCGKDARK